MEIKEFQAKSKPYFEEVRTHNNPISDKLLALAGGLIKETSELYDPIHDHVFRSKPLDEGNLKEELGDVAWYITNIADTMNWDMESILSANWAKIRFRHGAGGYNKNKEIEKLFFK